MPSGVDLGMANPVTRQRPLMILQQAVMSMIMLNDMIMPNLVVGGTALP
jgi:hypothetical protein